MDSTHSHSLVAMVRFICGISSNNCTVSFQLALLHAWFIACLWMSIHALCDAAELNAVRSSVHPITLATAVSRRRSHAMCACAAKGALKVLVVLAPLEMFTAPVLLTLILLLMPRRRCEGGAVVWQQ